MPDILASILSYDNVAIFVLLLVLAGGYKMFREERKADREAREKDALQCAGATDRQTAAMRELTATLVDLRIELARRGHQ